MNLNLNELYFEYKEEVMDAIQFMKHEYPIIDKIIKIVETTKLINYSSFCVYLQVIGYSYNAYMSEKSKMTIDFL